MKTFLLCIPPKELRVVLAEEDLLPEPMRELALASVEAEDWIEAKAILGFSFSERDPWLVDEARPRLPKELW